MQIFMKLEFSRQIFDEYSNIKLYENPFSGFLIMPCGRQMDGRTYGQTDMTKLKVGSLKFCGHA
jgi:hypothetical protein